MKQENKIDLIEFPFQSVEELQSTQKFFNQVFNWKFKSWGDDYADTQDSGLTSGLIADEEARPSMPLTVIYVTNLEETRERTVKAGGKITKEIFSFPGGRRFHFKDPAGNELAAWSE